MFYHFISKCLPFIEGKLRNIFIKYGTDNCHYISKNGSVGSIKGTLINVHQPSAFACFLKYILIMTGIDRNDGAGEGNNIKW